MRDDSIFIENLGLSVRAENALKRNGINTLAQMMEFSDEDFMKMRGFGKNCVDEIREIITEWLSLSQEELDEVVSEYNNKRIGYMIGEQKKMEVGEYLNSLKGGERLISILKDYYVTTPRLTLDDVGREYDVSRERIRQIIERSLRKVREGILKGAIDYNCIETIKQAAEKKTELSLINVSDSIFGRVGLIRIICAVYDSELEIVSTKRIHGEWLVKKGDKVGKMIDMLSRMLSDRDLPMRAEDVLTIFSIPEEMLFSVVNLIEKDGYVTLSTNKRATGTGRFEILRNFIKNVGRPVSINEIVDGTGMTFNQVRGSLCNKEEFVNVGKSVYDLVDEEYEDLSLSELARNILLAEDKALKISKVIEYIQRYRDIDYFVIAKELFSNSDSILYRHDGYVLLNEWGMDKIVAPKKRHYNVLLEDAIMDVVSEIDDMFTAGDISAALREKFGGSVTTNINTIKQKLSMLAQQEKIASIGHHTGCYLKGNN